MQYMAIMSTYSSELISVSSISAYDIYQTYINPRASRKQLMRVNYLSMTGFSTMLYYVGVGMGYLYLLMGVIISSAVLPATLTLIWSGMVSVSTRSDLPQYTDILFPHSPGKQQPSRPL